MEKTEIETVEELADWLGVDKELFAGGLDLPSASRVLGIGISTLRNRALKGEIRVQRDGCRWIFSWQDIAEYIEQRYQNAEAEAQKANEDSVHTCNRPYNKKAPVNDEILDKAEEFGLI